MNAIYEFILIFINLFIEMSFYLLFGMLFVALLYIILTKETIIKYLGKDNIWSVIKAAILGVPLPLCSCGVVPTAVYMSRSGASRGAVVSFLISTPQTGVDSIIATYGMMGTFMAIYRPLSALFSGIIGGTVIQKVKFIDNQITENKNESNKIENIKCSINENESTKIDISNEKSSFKQIFNKIKSGLKYAFIEFIDDIAPQFLLGLFIASLITYFVPDDYFSNQYISSGILGMLIMIAIGIPMYICSTASIPIAVSLILKGFSPGVAFVFLFTGPATNAATISILIKTLGKKLVLIYLIVLILLSIAFGYLLDYFVAVFDINIKLQMSHSHHTGSFAPSTFEIICAIIFLILVSMSIYRIYLKKYFITQPKSIINMNNKKYLKISGMNCNHCSNNVKNALEILPGISNISVDHNTGIAEYEGNVDINIIRNKIKEIGYELIENN